MMLTLVLGTFDVSVHFAQEAAAVGNVAQVNNHVFNGGILDGYVCQGCFRLNPQDTGLFLNNSLQFRQPHPVNVISNPVPTDPAACVTNDDQIAHAVREYLILPANYTQVGNVFAFENSDGKIVICRTPGWQNAQLENHQNAIISAVDDNPEQHLRSIIGGKFNTKKIFALFPPTKEFKEFCDDKGVAVFFVGLRSDSGFTEQLPLTHSIKLDTETVNWNLPLLARHIADNLEQREIRALGGHALDGYPKKYTPQPISWEIYSNERNQHLDFLEKYIKLRALEKQKEENRTLVRY